jgi:hypothetical protein
MRYALVDQSGNIVNVISWDEQTNWQPPDGLQAIRDKLGEAAPGGFFDGQSFLPPLKPQPVPPEPTIADRLAALEAEVAALKAQQPVATDAK